MYLDTHGSGGMGASMLRVSLRLVWPFTLIVSYLIKNNCHNLAPAVKMREGGTQTQCLATSVEKCLIMRPGSSAANIITIKEEEHEED